MIDLHSHLIPGVDDGSRSVEQSVRVLIAMRSAGITDVCLTPHMEASRATEGVPAAHDEAFARLQASAPKGIRLHRGAEVMLDRPFPTGAASNRRLTLAGSRYLLVEFTRLVGTTAVRSALAHVASLGLIPVLAHPERYACTTVELATTWKQTGAVMQVDATTLFRDRTRGERARALLAAGLADILAGDNHGDDRTVTGAWASLCEHGGQEQAALLLRNNPSAILEDRLIEPVPPLRIRSSLLNRIRYLLHPEG